MRKKVIVFEGTIRKDFPIKISRLTWWWCSMTEIEATFYAKYLFEKKIHPNDRKTAASLLNSLTQMRWYVVISITTNLHIADFCNTVRRISSKMQP